MKQQILLCSLLLFVTAVLYSQTCRVYCSDGTSYVVNCNTTTDPCRNGSTPTAPKEPKGPSKRQLVKEAARDLNHYGVMANEKGRSCRDARNWDCAITYFQEAIDYYQQAIDKDRDKIYKENLERNQYNLKQVFSFKFNEQGNSLYKQARYVDAEASYRMSLQYDPDYATAYSNLGLALEMQGRYDEAIAEYKKALKTDANFKDATEHLKRAEGKEVSQPVIGVAAQIIGDVKIQRNGGQEFNIKEKIALRSGDKIITKGNSKFKILLLDESSFTVGANSEMVLDEFVYDPNTAVSSSISATILSGSFRIVSGKDNKVKRNVQTRIIAIGIRGTDFRLTILPDSSGSIFLYHGLIDITEKTTGRVIGLKAGQSINFSSAGVLSEPVIFTEEMKTKSLEGLL